MRGRLASADALPGLPPTIDYQAAEAERRATDYAARVAVSPEGLSNLHLLVEGIRCGGCIKKIERALMAEPDVRQARVNMTSGRLAVAWEGTPRRAATLAALVAGLGFRVTPFDADRLAAADDGETKFLLRAMAVAGFAAANVMLLSVSVWAGHSQGMGPATRELLHWFSALIALPALLYAGRPFFHSALQALAAWRSNMDLPISLAVLLTAGMSLFETVRGGPHVYFDSAITLLFFLLLGRYLDRRARGQARAAAARLVALRSGFATVVDDEAATREMPIEAVAPGMRVLVAVGEQFPVDGEILIGETEVDNSLITGESLPKTAGLGDLVLAGTVNLAAPVTLAVRAVGEGTVMAEILRLMEAAEQRRARFVVLADRISRAYAPAVHLLALMTFLGWLWFGGLAWQAALLIAVAVLIITCPCALGLAVPAVQVAASGRLLRAGILLKSATALERLAQVDTILFDKTGTLTEGRLELVGKDLDQSALEVSAGMAAASRHPLARALVRALPGVAACEGVEEVAGQGLRQVTAAGEVRLGSRRWCGVEEAATEVGPELWLIRPGHHPHRFAFADQLRSDAAEVVEGLRRRGYGIELLSGDREVTVAAVAAQLGIENWRGACDPAGKCARLERLAADGRKVLMVGDGLNDAPSLAAAFASLSPTSAVDLAQVTADVVFQGDQLAPVTELLAVARQAERLVRQNVVLAFAYNALAVPLAVLGYVTPLIAAVAMSSSSLLVTGNALRVVRRDRL